jgi:hypothetical protein
MPSKSPSQAHTMLAVCKSPAFALKIGIPQRVGCDFKNADQAKAKSTGSKPLWRQWSKN